MWRINSITKIHLQNLLTLSKPHIYVGIGILLQEHASVRSVNHYIVWTDQYNQVVFLIVRVSGDFEYVYFVLVVRSPFMFY